MSTNVSLFKTVIALIAASFAVVAAAQDAGSRPTREYLQAAASSDQFEILAANAALGQSSNPEVRAFATRMIEDHQLLGKSLRDAAVRAGLKPPEMAMSADQAQLLAALQGLKGPDFDALYFKQQSLAHSSALTVELMYAKAGDDPVLRQFAGTVVPVVASHAAMADQAAKKFSKN